VKLKPQTKIKKDICIFKKKRRKEEEEIRRTSKRE